MTTDKHLRGDQEHRQQVLDALADLTTSAINELRKGLKILPPKERHALALQLYSIAVRHALRKPDDEGEADRKAMQEKFDQLLAGVLGK